MTTKKTSVKPLWQRTKWFVENYGLTDTVLRYMAKAGKVRTFKNGEGRGGMRLFNVADVEKILNGVAK